MKNEALEFPKPYNIMQMRRYLELVGWFREFIQNFSVVAAPLYNALKQKGALIWNEDMTEAFAELKLRLINARNLKLAEFEKKFTLKTDASNTGLVAVLLQEDKNGKLISVQ
ncbi:hypothetical protein, LTR Retrotransposon [Trachipleistophora hominis]|uniref:Reverse transcriptase/retrotransposon-derived protein RNase H-like domain-containing protein n=1 Tax=Trachipleistophora hominis TaxID=72359 RepID=L7JUV2_TRAHO|nr:hypothetical protein, LTR Retrotransposon [Trachipleistophora hominis]